MKKDKNDVINLIQRMPDDVTTADIMDELYFKQQVDQGLRDVAQGSISVASFAGNPRRTAYRYGFPRAIFPIDLCSRLR